jgi:RNA polymerase sigma factor (sigma-70 family)
MSDGTVRTSEWERGVRDRMVGGDDAALTDVYDQYSSFVYGLAARVIGDHRAAEDVTQDVFVSIWERPDSFDPGRGSLRTWLGTLRIAARSTTCDVRKLSGAGRSARRRGRCPRPMSTTWRWRW